MCNGGDHEKLKRICDARNKKGGKAAAAIRGNPHSKNVNFYGKTATHLPAIVPLEIA